MKRKAQFCCDASRDMYEDFYAKQSGRAMAVFVETKRYGAIQICLLLLLLSTRPRWRMAAILKTVKLPFLCNRLTDFDEIWHDYAYCPLQWKGRKISNF